MADGAPGIPGGTLTFLFTDIEGSTRKWEAEPGAMSVSLSRHDLILRESIEGRGGYVFKTVGDAFCASFRDPLAAIRAAHDAQSRLAGEPWPVGGGILVRMSLHSGVVEERDGDYFGPVLNRAARLLSLASGGQVLLSLATTELLHDHLPESFELRNLGCFRLKDLSRPETVAQLMAPGLRESFPALKSLDRMPNNLPLQPGSFVGREAELEAVRRALSPAGPAAGEACRLLSIIGPGGAGKTRLSVQAGAELLEDFEGGAWFVDLSSCRDGDESLREINRALSVREEATGRALEALERFLGRRRVLLILDNLEQDPGVGALVATLLGDCPGLACLATSREALRLRWERVLPLPPLSLPDREAASDPARLRQYEAVVLFVERAWAVKPDFAVTSRNAPAIAELCSRLDGIPLAIELAAARTRAFSVEDILVRLEADLGFLESGASDLPARQRTLRATAQWSYGLLSKAEKECFRALGAFRGAFSLDSAEAVLEAGGRKPKTASLLASLAEKSLLVLDETEGGARYRMLETLRAYAREKLAADPEQEALLDAHAARYLHLAGKAMGAAPARDMTGGEAAFYREIDLEYADLKAAFDRFMAKGDPVSALRLACGVHSYWRVRRMVDEGQARIGPALAAAGEGAPAELRSTSLRSLGELDYLRGDYGRAEESFEAALALAKASLPALAREAALSALGLGWVFSRSGRREEARKAFEAVASNALERGIEAYAALGLGSLDLVEGRIEEAAARLEKAYRGLMEGGYREAAAEAAGNLGFVELGRGNRSAGLARMADALRLSEELGDRENVMVAENNLAYYALEDGRHPEAAERYGRLESLARGTGSALFLAYALCGEAECLLAQGEAGAAARLAGEAVAVAGREGEACLPAFGIGLRIGAQAALAMGDTVEAARLAELAETRLSSDETELAKAQAVGRVAKGLRSRLGEKGTEGPVGPT